MYLCTQPAFRRKEEEAQAEQKAALVHRCAQYIHLLGIVKFAQDSRKEFRHFLR